MGDASNVARGQQSGRRIAMNDKTLSCPKCDKVGDDCGEHLPSWEELACYWKGKAEAQATRIEALEAALRDVFIHGHSEGWRGNQMRRDVKHEDAEKSWSLYVSNGALEKTIARKALESQP
jgi:hypothetical protein